MTEVSVWCYDKCHLICRFATTKTDGYTNCKCGCHLLTTIPDRSGGPAPAAPDAQEGNMTTATIEVEDEGAVEGTPRRIVLFTIAVLLPADFNDADIADIVPVSVKVDGHQDYVLTDLIQTGVQEARLAMAP